MFVSLEVWVFGLCGLLSAVLFVYVLSVCNCLVCVGCESIVSCPVCNRIGLLIRVCLPSEAPSGPRSNIPCRYGDVVPI